MEIRICLLFWDSETCNAKYLFRRNQSCKNVLKLSCQMRQPWIFFHQKCGLSDLIRSDMFCSSSQYSVCSSSSISIISPIINCRTFLCFPFFARSGFISKYKDTGNITLSFLLCGKYQQRVPEYPRVIRFRVPGYKFPTRPSSNRHISTSIIEVWRKEK
jgi:hypothetical protein